MRIGLLGYGKMGQAIEAEALPRGHEITHRLNLGDDRESLATNAPDVVIAFTHPDSFSSDLELCLRLGLPLVVGTTGWYDRLPEVAQTVVRAGARVMYSANFSIGVNILFKLNQRLAEWMNGYPEYDVYIQEAHHRHKADGPSGTAVALAHDILARLDRKNVMAPDLRQRKPQPEELSVGFVRAGEIIGEHQVTYTSEIDEIRIEHKARNRRGFALGAVVGAEALVKKEPGFYNFSELF